MPGRPTLILPLALLCFCFISSHRSHAQVVINEVCAKNSSTLLDEDGDSPDWIELYNSGGTDVDLEDYTLTDNADLSDGWELPDIELNAGEFVIIYASGKDRDDLNYPHTDFKLDQDGETLSLLDENDQLVHQLISSYLQLDHSFGLPVGSTTGALFGSPTPGSANVTSSYPAYAEAPGCNTSAGHYEQPITLELLPANAGDTIYYSTDGSAPTSSSSIYSAPLTIGGPTSVRFYSAGVNSLPSEVITRTYLISEDLHLPVIALSTDPSPLFHPDTGIYVLGPNAQPTWPFWGANFWSEEQLPAYVEYFAPDGDRVFGMNIDTRMHGGKAARTVAQKPFRLLAKNKYGDDGVFDYAIFSEKDNAWYKRLVLRNSGGDFNRLHFRDALLHQLLLHQNLNVDAVAARPVRVYINGEYWGVMHLREKVDRYYLASNYGVNPDSLDLLEEDTAVIDGNRQDFEQMHDFITMNDMQNEQNFAQASDWIDIESLADYFIAQTCLANTDWPYNNLKYWKSHEPGSKWRYLLFDLDGSLNLTPWATHETDALGRIFSTYGDTNKHVNILEALLMNDTYHNYFINRYADLMNTAFHPNTMMDEFDVMAEEIAPEMDRHFNRWGGNLLTWRDEMLEKALPFIEQRTDLAREYVRASFDLEHEVLLRIQTYPPDAGSIQLNTLEPDLPWEGRYYHGNAVHLKAKANEGYTFSHWQSLNALVAPQNSDSLTWDFKTDDVITAYFTGGTDFEARAIAYPNPFQNNMTVQFVLPAIETVAITLYDATGREIKGWTSGELNGGLNRVNLETGPLPAGIYLISIQSESLQETVRVMAQ